MPCALEVTDKRPKNTSRMRCNGLVGNDNFFPEDHLIHRPVYGFPDNRDSPFTVLSLGHSSDWKLAPFSSSRQEVNRARYLTLGTAATEGFELLFPQPTIVYWLDLPNEKNMHDQDISSKPHPNGGSTVGQHRHRKKIKKSLTACPPCHAVASTSSGPDTAPLGSDSDILHDDDKPPKRSSKKKVNKWKQCRRATGEKLNLLPELPREEHIDTASPVEVFLPDLLAGKLSDASSSACSLVKDAHLGKDNGESNNEYVEHGSDGKDGSGYAGSSNIYVGKRVSCKGAPYLNDGPNTADSSEFGEPSVTEHAREESNSCQKSLCACVCNSSDATTASFFTGWNSENCGDCSIDFEGNTRDGLQHGASTCLDSVNKVCHLTDVHLSGAHAEDVTDTSSHSERVQCSSEACSSKTFLPVSPGRSGRKSRNKSSCTNVTATNRVVGSNRHKHSGKDSPVSVWQKVEKTDKENSSGAGHVVVSAVEDKSALEDDSKGVQHDPNRPMDKHRCRKNCKQHKKQTLSLYEQTSLSCKKGSCPSPRNYYAPKNGSPKTPKNHSQQTEGLSMLQPVCARDISDTSIITGTEKATVASYNLGSHLVPQVTSNEPCTLVIQDDSHSLCLENKAISTDLDCRNLCVGPCAAEMEETQCVKSYSSAGHMSHKWVPIGKKDITHLDVPEASVVEASVPANDVSLFANIEVQRNVSDAPASTKCEGSKVATELTAKLKPSGQLDSKCQGHTDNGTVFSMIREAVSDAHTAQQRAEDIQLHIGRPLADFEQFIYSASPVLHCSSCPTGCNSSSQEWIRDGLCCHQTADISLSSIWQWYEEPGCYGLEVKAQDLRRSKGLWNSRYQFNAYFVPYLSAVQLFRQPKRTVDKDEADMGARSKTSPCMSSLPILAKLLPQESNKRNSSLAFHDKEDQQLETTEIIFEFFESEQPFWRRQLFDRVKELIGGAKQSNCQISGDPKNLELSLHDLHPASWYCVAWYPIYRIPDGKFQAAFLTYHSLGHWVHRGNSADQAGHCNAVLPVMGLQSYNDKGEWWFQTSRSGSEDSESSSSEPSQVLEERLSTLNQAAAAMARADVWKKDQAHRNRHPDYEFFLSRQQR
ncbi:uncharacterized protein LOC125522813 isoform X1 [Triticum urartu]|uniref:Uncharacterized protein n=2 Tax=Triticum urartu TaxID=4572 RepID=A0A8R7V7Z8_TRIUA|nr:uncharacterized protein LOC125522813 isoform X1 [Triticum urartu]XP_048543802.1 uncharacterized protein LOC125522813 isoform X1 [Triticum urartu]